jgi:hypothetical protein
MRGGAPWRMTHCWRMRFRGEAASQPGQGQALSLLYDGSAGPPVVE